MLLLLLLLVAVVLVMIVLVAVFVLLLSSSWLLPYLFVETKTALAYLSWPRTSLCAFLGAATAFVGFFY